MSKHCLNFLAVPEFEEPQLPLLLTIYKCENILKKEKKQCEQNWYPGVTNLDFVWMFDTSLGILVSDMFLRPRDCVKANSENKIFL